MNKIELNFYFPCSKMARQAAFTLENMGLQVHLMPAGAKTALESNTGRADGEEVIALVSGNANGYKKGAYLKVAVPDRGEDVERMTQVIIELGGRI